MLTATLLSALLSLLLPRPAPHDSTEPRAHLALIDVAVVDVEAGALLPHHTVLVRDDRIAWVGPASDAELPADTRRVDGSGRFVMPGLWDLHVHLERRDDSDVSLPMFLAHGVTGVREMGSARRDDADFGLRDMQAWRAEIERGERVGPRLLVLSSWPVARDADLAGDADALVADFASRGVELVKILQGLSPEGFDALRRAAAAHELPVAGHVPLAVGLAGAAAAGLTSVEHARDVIFDGFPGAAAWRASTDTQNPPTAVLREMLDTHDPELLRPLARAMAASDTAYVPTHVTRLFDARADDAAFLADPRARFVPALRWDEWRADAASVLARDPSDDGRRALRDMHALGLAATRVLLDEGVTVLAGSDANDSYAFPGSGLHDELAELVRAGLSPAEALRAATLAGARFLGREADFGSVAPGRKADLLLLDGDPLTDVAHARAPRAVILDGRLHDRAALDALLDGVAARVAAAAPSVPVAPDFLERCVGEYTSRMGSAGVTLERGALLLRLGSRGGLRLRAIDATRFVHLPRDAEIDFQVDASGAVTGFRFEQGGRAVEATRVER